MVQNNTRELFGFFQKNASDISGNEKLLQKAGDTVSLFNKLILSFRLYPGKNPIFKKFSSRFLQNLNDMFKEIPVVSIRITHRGFHFAEHALKLSEKDNETAQYLYNDGLRELYFQQGIDYDETQGFFRLIARATAYSNEDYDIPTLLWQGDLTHIGYITEDELVNPYAFDRDNGEPFSVEMLRDVDRGGAGAGMGIGDTDGAGHSDRDGGDSVGFLSADDFANHEFERIYGFLRNEHSGRDELYEQILSTFSILPEHKEKLAELVSRRTEERITDDFLKKITERMFNSTGPLVRKNLIETSSVLWEKLIMFGSVRGAIAFLRNLISVGSHINNRESDEYLTIKEGMEKLSDRAFLGDLFDQSDSFPDEEVPHFGEFLALVPQKQFPFILERISALESREKRLLFVNSLSEHVEVTPFLLNTLRNTIKTADWTVVRNTLNLLRHMKNPAVMPLLKNAVNHPKKQVQMEAISVLMEYSIEDALPVLTRALMNSDKNIRRLAFEKLLSSRASEVKAVINRRFHETALKEMKPEERTMYFNLVIEHNRDDLVPLFAIHLFSSDASLRKNVLDSVVKIEDTTSILPQIEKVLAMKKYERYSKKELDLFFSLVRPETIDHLKPHLAGVLSATSTLFSRQSRNVKRSLFSSISRMVDETGTVKRFIRRAAQSDNSETKNIAEKYL